VPPALPTRIWAALGAVFGTTAALVCASFVTLPRPTIVAVMPETVPVKVGLPVMATDPVPLCAKVVPQELPPDTTGMPLPAGKTIPPPEPQAVPVELITPVVKVAQPVAKPENVTEPVRVGDAARTTEPVPVVPSP